MANLYQKPPRQKLVFCSIVDTIFDASGNIPKTM